MSKSTDVRQRDIIYSKHFLLLNRLAPSSNNLHSFNLFTVNVVDQNSTEFCFYKYEQV